MHYAKKDFWLAVLAGEIVALLSLPTLKNLNILDLLAKWGISFKLFMAFWTVFIPICAVLGLSFFYLIAKYKSQVGFFQLGKYIIIGFLNTLLNAGIYNFLIFATNVAKGFTLDIFFGTAFVITVANSFFWNKYWSFEEKRTETFRKEAVNFFGVSAAVALINVVILHIIVNVIGAPAEIEAKIWANIGLGLTIITAFLGNFFGYKYIVFKK